MYPWLATIALRALMVPPVASLNCSIRSLIIKFLNLLVICPPLYLKSKVEQALFSQQVIHVRLQL